MNDKEVISIYNNFLGMKELPLYNHEVRTVNLQQLDTMDSIYRQCFSSEQLFSNSCSLLNITNICKQISKVGKLPKQFYTDL